MNAVNSEVPGGVGFIGLGNMGGRMIRPLSAHGFDVIAFDISPEKRSAITSQSGIFVADSMNEALSCDVVILMLPNGDAVLDVLTASHVANEHIPDGALIIDMSSSDPAIYAGLAHMLSERNIRIIDAPVSGSLEQAEAGTLTIMVGGDSEDTHRSTEYLEAMGSRIYNVGQRGSGQTVKAINNLMTAGGLLMALEAISMAEKAGLDPQFVNEILNVSTGRNDATARKIEPYVLSETFDSGFHLSLLAKDLRIARSIAENVNGHFGLGAHVVETYCAAEKDLDSQADHTEIARWLTSK